MPDSSIYLVLLSAIVFLPAAAAILVAFIPSNRPDAAKVVTLFATTFVFVIAVAAMLNPFNWLGPDAPTQFKTSIGEMQCVFNVPWIPSFDIEYYMGTDGISFPLVLLTAFVTVCSMGASWTINKYVKAYCILFLLLETGMIGCFLALDLFLFYVFWEVMLLPMYFLIGVWGGPRREYAAIKFFLYTLFGSVLMLIAILMLYFASDLRTLAEADFAGKLGTIKWSDIHVGKASSERIGLHRTSSGVEFLRLDQDQRNPLEVKFVKGEGVETTVDYKPAEHDVSISVGSDATWAKVADAVAKSPEATKVLTARVAPGAEAADPVDVGTAGFTMPAYAGPSTGNVKVHTFNILALSAMGQKTALFSGPILFGLSMQWWAFLLLFIGFIIKVPSVPVHTWLPDAHVEAPTPISMILAGVLLKLGGYGIIRICYPICPEGGYELRYLVCGLGVVSMVYGGLAALAQKDFKRMVAYSSVSHMGYVLLGLGVWSATAATNYDWQYWDMGVKGAMYQMIGHGISSPGMFLMVGIIYERVHHRNLDEFGGLFGKMPVYTALAMGIFFAGLGLPGLCGFVGEVLVVLSSWKFSMVLAIISASVVIITAAYILWAIQRVYLGAEYKGPHGEHIHPSDTRENLIGGALLFFCILFGIFPHLVLQYMDKTIDRQVQQLTDWTRQNEAIVPSEATAATEVGSNPGA
jgi:NADH:ubiquinone oxidoreductase subunit 4 (subunit M)